MNYLVVLFKNKERKKIINKFITYERAEEFYNKLITESNSVNFKTLIENATPVNYELGLLKKNSDDFNLLFVKDKLGRQIKVDLDDPEYKIIKLNPYNVSEKIYSIDYKKKISFESFVRSFLPKNTIKLISKLNNKIALQNDDDIKLFSLKNEIESKRFLDSLSDFMIRENRIDCIIVSETSKEQKKYLYDLLSQKGISKQSLYRVSTTFKNRK
jgi:hypothetical protein